MKMAMQSLIVLVDKLCNQPEVLIMFLVIIVLAYLLVTEKKGSQKMAEAMQASVVNMSNLSTQLNLLLQFLTKK